MSDVQKLRAQTLRDRLKSRRAEKRERKPLRFPFVLDDELAGEVQGLVAQVDMLEARVEHHKEKLEAAAEKGESDARASGDDPSATKLQTAETELARIKDQLAQAVRKVEEGRFWLVFRPCGSARYEEILARHPEADEDLAVKARFGDALMVECFEGFEDDKGEPIDLGYSSFADFLAEADLDFGEIDPMRTAILIANNRNPHFGLAR